MDYLVSGMISMLREGVANVGMSFFEVQDACDEPDLHEFDGITLDEMLAKWEAAKVAFSAERGTAP
jgi:hypothetical protein|nr:hypothetical protein [Neorhizobium tomejilense]